MNKFEVKTPEAWKDRLYKSVYTSKRKRPKAAVLLAAVLAAVLCFSLTAFAVKVTKAPEYFGSMFLGQSESADAVYSEKNIPFKSDNEDFELICKGIVGDNNYVHIVFEIHSNGDTVFDDENYSYWFEDIYEDIPFSLSYGKSGAVYVKDGKTLEANISLSGSGIDLVGKTLTLDFKNIEVYEKNTFNKKSVIAVNFSGKVTIDYYNTQCKLKRTDNTVNVNNILFRPIKSEISNLNLDYTLENITDSELDDVIGIEKFASGNLTLIFIDGKSVTYRIKMPPEKETYARAGTIGIRNNRLHLQISFPEPVNAKNVASVILNDVEVFRKSK